MSETLQSIDLEDVLEQEAAEVTEQPSHEDPAEEIADKILEAEALLKDVLECSELDIVSGAMISEYRESPTGEVDFIDEDGKAHPFKNEVGGEFAIQDVHCEEDFRGREFGGSIKIYLGSSQDAQGNITHRFLEQTYRAPEYVNEETPDEPDLATKLAEGNVLTELFTPEQITNLQEAQGPKSIFFEFWHSLTQEHIQEQSQVQAGSLESMFTTSSEQAAVATAGIELSTIFTPLSSQPEVPNLQVSSEYIEDSTNQEKAAGEQVPVEAAASKEVLGLEAAPVSLERPPLPSSEIVQAGESPLSSLEKPPSLQEQLFYERVQAEQSFSTEVNQQPTLETPGSPEVHNVELPPQLHPYSPLEQSPLHILQTEAQTVTDLLLQDTLDSRTQITQEIFKPNFEQAVQSSPLPPESGAALGIQETNASPSTIEKNVPVESTPEYIAQITTVESPSFSLEYAVGEEDQLDTAASEQLVKSAETAVVSEMHTQIESTPTPTPENPPLLSLERIQDTFNPIIEAHLSLPPAQETPLMWGEQTLPETFLGEAQEQFMEAIETVRTSPTAVTEIITATSGAGVTEAVVVSKDEAQNLTVTFYEEPAAPPANVATPEDWLVVEQANQETVVELSETPEAEGIRTERLSVVSTSQVASEDEDFTQPSPATVSRAQTRQVAI